MTIDKKKEKIRKEIWDEIYKNKQTYRENGDYGKIPDFKGKTEASQKLRETTEYKNAKTIFVSPDSAQTPIRYNTIIDNKTLIIASPNLKKDYIILNKTAKNNPQEASDKNKAIKYGIQTKKLPPVDMIVEGSVGVDLKGHRIGKGKGYGDREINELIKQKCITKKTPIITTIHPLQIKEEIPHEPHDKNVNMIITPKNKIYTKI